ncbi:MAG TPA: adenylate/guanylate cyclase domain-containing protein, partial [Candidatus Polarisedimenticolaceae bacterium]|nr:adenylate/guanylate cyclase domain-containing protein [Candidatus Polarisedimenticolaceae bacterium]
PRARATATTDVRLSSFQARLLTLVVGSFAVVLTATLLLVSAANRAGVRRQIDEALELATGVFHQSIADRVERLVEAARLLAGDFAFKSAYATGERATVRSALENHRARIGADVMLLASLDYEILADTRDGPGVGSRLPVAQRLDELVAEGRLELSTIAFLDDAPYQIVVVPLMVPIPDAWICVGFRIDDAFVERFKRLTLADVSLLARRPDGWSEIASTLAPARRAALPEALGRAETTDDIRALTLAGETFVSLATPLGEVDDAPLVAVLQRSLTSAMAPHRRLRRVLIGLFFAALAVGLLFSLRLAASVSRPVLRLAAAAGRVERGDYRVSVVPERPDEIGRLTESFNHMTRGLAERDHVRDLLGKVVSPAVAHELIHRGIELGGEERPVSILFADVRDFTTLCENVAPALILARLNRYLTAMSGVIETEAGVVDKYVGDAIMALFGAPLPGDDHPLRAVRAALEMHRALSSLNAEFRAERAPEFHVGIGVNSGIVVAGNMGSPTRSNYTVIGDGVNVASRLERLTKTYGVGLLVSRATRQAATGFEYRELDRVRVKGKREPVTIYEPLGPPDRLDAATRERAATLGVALAAYRERNWDVAHREFTALRAAGDATLARLFLQRIERLRGEPPGPDWDGTFARDAGG